MLCFAHHFLYLLVSLPVDDRLMDILEDDPVFFRVLQPSLIFERLGVGFEIDNVTAVFLVGKDLGNAGFALLIGVRLHPFATSFQAKRIPVGHGDQHLPFLQNTGNGFLPLTLQTHPKDIPNDISGIGIHDPLLFVLRGL